MSIISVTPYYVGQVNQLITRWKLVCTDTLSQVTTANFLNTANLMGYNPSPNDIFDVIYLYNGSISVLGSGTYTECTCAVSYSQGVATYTLSQISQSGVSPSVANDIVTFSNTTGGLQDSGILVSNAVLKNAINTMAAGSSIVLAKVNGTEAANAVTASGVAGVITTSSLTTAGGSSYVITWTNTFISATSSVMVTLAGGTNTTENITLKVAPGSGSATLTIYNNTASTALNGTLLISYAVL